MFEINLIFPNFAISEVLLSVITLGVTGSSPDNLSGDFHASPMLVFNNDANSLLSSFFQNSYASLTNPLNLVRSLMMSPDLDSNAVMKCAAQRAIIFMRSILETELYPLSFKEFSIPFSTFSDTERSRTISLVLK